MLIGTAINNGNLVNVEVDQFAYWPAHDDYILEHFESSCRNLGVKFKLFLKNKLSRNTKSRPKAARSENQGYCQVMFLRLIPLL